MTLQHADTLLALGRHEEALQALSSLGDEGASARAHGLRARAYLGLRKWKEADEAAAAAIIAAPEWEWGYRLAAIAARNRGRKREARRLAQEAVRVGPNEAYSHQIAALTALDLGDATEALEHAETMARLAPNDPISHRTLGRCMIARRQFAAAEGSLRKSLELNPQDHEAMTLLAEVVGGRDKDQARELRLSALRASPQTPEYRKNVLRRGGLAVGGAVFAISKVGLLGKFALIGGVHRLFLRGGGNDEAAGDVLLALIVIACVLAFAVTRIRRRLHGKKLPPLVWEGTRADRRNADLKWFAWPAGLGLFGSTVATLAQLANALAPTGLVYMVVSLSALALCWRLRLGDARSITLGQMLGRIGRGFAAMFRFRR